MDLSMDLSVKPNTHSVFLSFFLSYNTLLGDDVDTRVCNVANQSLNVDELIFDAAQELLTGLVPRG